MNTRCAFIIPAMLAASLFGAGCAAPAMQDREVVPEKLIQNSTSVAPIVGGDRDGHGCIGSAGYRWCEPRQECLRFWETPCYASAEEGIRAALADALKLKPADIFVIIRESTPDFAKGTVGKVGEEDGPAGMFLASQGNNIWLVDYHGNGQADCATLKERGYPASMLKNVCE
jgi:hypothetical protein